jgi:hypothetical protein
MAVLCAALACSQRATLLLSRDLCSFITLRTQSQHDEGVSCRRYRRQPRRSEAVSVAAASVPTAWSLLQTPRRKPRHVASCHLRCGYHADAMACVHVCMSARHCRDVPTAPAVVVASDAPRSTLSTEAAATSTGSRAGDAAAGRSDAPRALPSHGSARTLSRQSTSGSFRHRGVVAPEEPVMRLRGRDTPIVPLGSTRSQACVVM